MTTYIAFLRGINVGAHNRMKMEELRAACESLGYENVRTYIQSGNVVFDASETDAEVLETDLSDAIDAEFGFEVPVLIRTRAELEAVVDRRPFDSAPDESTDLYVTFLAEEPTEAKIRDLEAARTDAEEVVVRGRAAYSLVHRDTHEAGRYTDVGTILDVPATRRKWNVILSVLDLAADG